MRKKKKTKESQETKVKESQSLFVKILKNQRLIKILIGALVVLYPIANYIYSYIYKLQCESFYKLPGRYFSESIDNRLISIAILVVIFVTAFVPIEFMNRYRKEGEESKYIIFISLFVSILQGLILVMNNMNIFIRIEKLDYKDNIMKFVINYLYKNVNLVLLPIIIMSVIFSLSMVLMTLIKQKLIKIILIIMLCVSYSVNFILFLCGIKIKMGTTIEDKTKYEIVTNMERQYIVLSEENEKVLVVEYRVKDDKYVFSTEKYLFLNKYDCEFSYIDTGVSPKIENANNKE